jgi:hypothetical protein
MNVSHQMRRPGFFARMNTIIIAPILNLNGMNLNCSVWKQQWTMRYGKQKLLRGGIIACRYDLEFEEVEKAAHNLEEFFELIMSNSIEFH